MLGHRFNDLSVGYPEPFFRVQPQWGSRRLDGPQASGEQV